MNNDIKRININRDKKKCKIEYYIFTSNKDIDNHGANDQSLKNFISSIKWDINGFEYPVVRIYNILDEEGKQIDESDIAKFMETFIFFMNSQFEDIHYPTAPIYFTTVADPFESIPNGSDAFEKYKNALAYECMQFELAGFFNIRAKTRDKNNIPFVYANETAQNMYIHFCLQ